MRPLFTLVLIAAWSLILGSCAGVAIPSAGVEPGAGLPAVADLARLASETSEGSTTSPFGQVVAMTDGVTEITTTPSRFRIQCEGTGAEQWVILGMTGLKPGTAALRYSFIEADTIHEFQGGVFTGIADFSLGAWRFQDVSMTGWREGWPDEHFGGIDIPPVAQPVGPNGSLYFAMIVYGEWAEGSCARRLELDWEYDEPFLAAPVLLDPNGPPDGWPLWIDPGPDSQLSQAGTLAVWRCEGVTWDPESAEEVDSFAPGDEAAPWSFTHGSGAWTYAAALEVDNAAPLAPLASAWSNVITRVHE